ncbi:MAG: S1 family peptidase [Bdellovibrionales bacterium]|nr:S1 family peptidase [Bdellovibrionales bacterium]
MRPLILSMVFLCTYAPATQRLINGQPVDSGTYKEVVWITSSSSGCTATVVGPRTIVTASHCATTGTTVKFNVNGTQYSARITRNPEYNNSTVSYDVALGYVDKEVTGVEYATLGVKGISTGMGITLLGYGCTRPNGGVDGTLRIGESVIISTDSNRFGSRKSGGATLCPGDSGGPAFVFDGDKRYLVGINSTVTTDFVTSYNARTEISQQKSFFEDFARTNSVEICGVNKDCFKAISEPPTCQLSAQPSSIQLGESVTFELRTEGEVTSAKIGQTSVNFPLGTLTSTPSQAGTFTQSASVIGPGGSASCSASYEVKGAPAQNAPSCTLTAAPNPVSLGQTVRLTLAIQGNATHAAIDGESVNLSNPSVTRTPMQIGQHLSSGYVMGPGGSGECRTSFAVEDKPSQTLPGHTVVPGPCGTNTNGSTVREVCLAVLKKVTVNVRNVSEALLIRYQDGGEEVMPVLSRYQDNGQTHLSLYANSTYKQNQYWVLDARDALVQEQSGQTTAISGTTIRGIAFDARF